MLFKLLVYCGVINIVKLNASVITAGRRGRVGTPCYLNNEHGICRTESSCSNTLTSPEGPHICSHGGDELIVCCSDDSSIVFPGPIVEPPKIPTRPHTCNKEDKSRRRGIKAWDKCIEYQEQIQFPCVRSPALGDGPTHIRKQRCKNKGTSLITGGTTAEKYEFPHMARLGYEEEGKIEWRCGGVLISEEYILTAGHCTSTNKGVNVSHILLGALGEDDALEKRTVKEIIKHPGYLPPNKYNDIALLKIDKVELSLNLVPGCLHISDDTVNDTKVIGTGWGQIAYRGPTASLLQKVTLDKISTERCTDYYPGGQYLHLRNGHDPETQLCFGDDAGIKDTCSGDSGSPLQVRSSTIDCMFTIVGLTSISHTCEHEGAFGIYTRVEHYVDWIESIVWP